MLSATCLLLVGQVLTEPQEKLSAKVQQHYESFVRAAGRYEMRLKDDDGKKLTIVDKPVLRWGNQARENDVGAVFVWTDEGRPQAAVAIFLWGGRPMHELVSLAESPLTTTWGESATAWRPARPGVVFRKIPGAPVAAETRPARLTQMRTMADDFTAATTAPPNYIGGRSHGELRLLRQPLYRHPDESSVALDGALFTFVFGTDPEVLLLVEARSTPAGHVWHYAAAPFTDFAIELTHKNQSVWSEPLARDSQGPNTKRPHAGIWQHEYEGDIKQP